MSIKRDSADLLFFQLESNATTDRGGPGWPLPGIRGLARAGKFTAGAVPAIGVAAIAGFAVVILNPCHLFTYAFRLFAILPAALLFSVIGTRISAAGVFFRRYHIAADR